MIWSRSQYNTHTFHTRLKLTTRQHLLILSDFLVSLVAVILMCSILTPKKE